MHWNSLNTCILCFSLLLSIWALLKLWKGQRNWTSKLLNAFVLFGSLVILQVILIDVGITRKYPILLLFYLPYQFLCPVLFIGFTFAYVGEFQKFRKKVRYLLIPFLLFFGLYTFLKVNVFAGYRWLSIAEMGWVNQELDENLAVLFAMGVAIYNHRVLKKYKRKIGNLPFHIVEQKTKWLVNIFMVFVVLSVVWVGVILLLRWSSSLSGHGPYYPLWLVYLSTYSVLMIWGLRHLASRESKSDKENSIPYLNVEAFINGSLYPFPETAEQNQITQILTYFATSLFDKNTESDVLWDIAKNCIAKLDLEDCILYRLDDKKNTLIQKAAYGHKDGGNKKILSPIEIPCGFGIVGSACRSGVYQKVNVLKQDPRYIVDDKARGSELAVPIFMDSEVWGILDSEHSEEYFFTDQHVQLFQLIAKLTAIKLGQLKKVSQGHLTEENAHYQNFLGWLNQEKSYANPDLSLETASTHLSISPGYLSQLINAISGTSFPEFINALRVNEAKQLLMDPEYANYTIVAVGLEAGFNSKSAFYNAFKRQTGQTPSEYRSRYKMVS
ncbi:MAG: helix-turn-helix domain-containing protein [Bacteroidota bacterium]